MQNKLEHEFREAVQKRQKKINWADTKLCRAQLRLLEAYLRNKCK